MRQDGQCHILECDRRTMKQLQIICILCLCKRCDHLRVKLGIICAVDTGLKLALREIREIKLHHLISNLPVIHLGKLFQALIQSRNMIRHEKSAVIGQPL